jgi:hypothetical protein
MSSEIDKTKASAERGDPDAQFRLGWDYYIGNGVVRDKMEAIKWYTAAANQGFSKAHEILKIIEANKIHESKDSFVDTEENKYQASVVKSKKYKFLAGFFILCVFIMLLLDYIYKNTQWSSKKTEAEKSIAQPKLDLIDGKSDPGNQIVLSEVQQSETELVEKEIMKEPNEIYKKANGNSREEKIIDKNPQKESAKSKENTDASLMERLAIFADKWLEGDSEPNEAHKQEVGQEKK